MTSQHNTGTHPFYIGMYIHICTHIYVHIYTSQKECLCIFFPYTTCFFPQPEKPTSRAPFFRQKLATLLFTGLPLLDPSTAKLTHFITKNTSSQTLCTRQVYSSSLLHQTPFTPDTTSHAQAVSFHSQKSPKVEPLFLEKLATLLFTGLPLLGPSTAKLIHFITQNTSSQTL